MQFLALINRVLASDLLIKELTIIPPPGASVDEIATEEAIMNRALCADHRLLLSTWNGLGLDVIRFFGCGADVGKIGRISQMQLPVAREIDGVVVASDPAGFAYIQMRNGAIFLFDTDGGVLKSIASGIDDLLIRYIFGTEANLFGGSEWTEDLKRARLL